MTRIAEPKTFELTRSSTDGSQLSAFGNARATVQGAPLGASPGDSSGNSAGGPAKGAGGASSGETAGEEQHVPFDEDAAWRAIVAGFGEEPPDPPGAKPFRSVEDLALLEPEPEESADKAPDGAAGPAAPKPLGSSVAPQRRFATS